MHGLVLCGEFRRVKTFRVKPEDSPAYDQLVALILDNEDDQMHKVTCPRESEAAFRAAFGGREGSEVAVSVGMGSYQKLWYRGLVDGV